MRYVLCYMIQNFIKFYKKEWSHINTLVNSYKKIVIANNVGFALVEMIIGISIIIIITQIFLLASLELIHTIHSVRGGNEILMDARYSRILIANRVGRAKHGLEITNKKTFIRPLRESWGIGLQGSSLVVELSNGRKQSITQDLIHKKFGYIFVYGPSAGVLGGPFTKNENKTIHFTWKTLLKPTNVSTNIYKHNSYIEYNVDVNVLPDYEYYAFNNGKNK